MMKRKFTQYLLILCSLCLSGCTSGMLNPKGKIAVSQTELFVFVVFIMLIVVIPVFIMTAWFGLRYRNKNEAAYRPDWAHNVLLETIWWGIPFLIIVILAVATWISSHTLSPYRAIASKTKPLTIQVVALNWKWLFIYPKQGIATVNYLQLPVNTPVRFLITSDAPMNSFVIPRLAGQIYAMSGMQTELNLIANKKGEYTGFSANYSGVGFADMHFVTQVDTANDFNKWVETIKHSSNPLTIERYAILAKDSENNPPAYFSIVSPSLFKDIMKKYMQPSTTSGSDQPDHL